MEAAEEAEQQSFEEEWKQIVHDPVLVKTAEENRSGFESVIAYIFIAFAVIQVRDVSAGVSFLTVLAVLAFVFFGGNHLSAYVQNAIQLKDQHSTGAGWMILDLIAKFCQFLKIYVSYLLVQVLMQKANPSISDGHWNPINLVLPVLLFGLLFVLWRAYSFRSEFPLQEAERLTKANNNNRLIDR
jgi:hypothetical protein